MGQNDDPIGPEDKDPSRTLDAVMPLYELSIYDGRRWSLYVDGERDATPTGLAFPRIDTSTDHVPESWATA